MNGTELCSVKFTFLKNNMNNIRLYILLNYQLFIVSRNIKS